MGDTAAVTLPAPCGSVIAVEPASVRTLRCDGVHYLEPRDDDASSKVQAAVRVGETNPTAIDLHELLIDNQ
ncbi:type 2 periplasmic-binding domain-containing protein [Solicola gregarius]|uniref:Uncharacterized protein n=1 Tax=Solicola gregarius TaxID=2908642 RepID=A0AA46TFL1_9ACTN|nr:hypothetical protein [Solicola gregarius]UYM04206.1 hypothetical protein L0C25_16875 [Solicola gregarius]